MPVSILLGVAIGFVAWFLVRYLVAGIYTVNQNERAVKTSFGRAERVGTATTLEDPIAESLLAEEKERYYYPQVRVIPPGGPYFKWPWEKIYKVSIATQTVNMAFDPENPSANQGGTMLEAVTKDQLNTGLTGQIRYRVSEKNLYAYLFGVKRPIVHVMGYFTSVLRERIANFEAPPAASGRAVGPSHPHAGDRDRRHRRLDQRPAQEPARHQRAHGPRMQVLRRALRHRARRLAHHRHRSAGARSSPPSPPSTPPTTRSRPTSASPRPAPTRRSCSPRRAVEIETLKAQAEVEPLKALAAQLRELKKSGPGRAAGLRAQRAA